VRAGRLVIGAGAGSGLVARIHAIELAQQRRPDERAALAAGLLAHGFADAFDDARIDRRQRAAGLRRDLDLARAVHV